MSLTESRAETSDSEFDRGIAVRARQDDPLTYEADLGVGWQVGADINGGLLLALAGNALRQTFSADDHRDPI